MKITEAWENRELVIEKRTYKGDFTILIYNDNQIDFENVILRNFWWFVREGILEEWLPDELPECKMLDCRNCHNLTKLPKLPKCEILDCRLCTNLTSLPELSECEILDCRLCKNIISLPELPKCKRLYCTDCKKLTALPELPKIEVLFCDERFKK